MNEQAEQKERRADNNALLAGLADLRNQFTSYAEKLQKIEIDHETRIRILEAEGARVSEKLESLGERLESIERAVAGIPGAIANLIGQHEKSEMTLMLSIAGGVLLLVVGFLWDAVK